MTERNHLRATLRPGSALGHWQMGDTREARYDLPDRPMQGEMDPFFFRTRHKNFIPHAYPCRTQFAAEHRDKRPETVGAFEAKRWCLPFGSPRLDVSGFWFRPTRIANWARTYLDAKMAGEAVLCLGTCGGAILWVNGVEAGWMAPYRRNFEEKREFMVSLGEGMNEVVVFFDDLAERDTRFFIEVDYLSGPEAALAVPVPLGGESAAAFEAALEGAHFDRTAYLGEEVNVLLSMALPCDVGVQVDIQGDFISGDRGRLELTLLAGATRVSLGSSDQMPADFRLFAITLSAQGFVATRTLGVEICHVNRQGEPPRALAARVDEALEEVATHSERDIVCALARLATQRGGVDTNAMIADRLAVIEDCHDCADFELVPLIWARFRFADALSLTLRAGIDRAMVGYRYWVDEPGNDVQWYFSENHALLFHTAAYLAGHFLPDATFVRSGRTGTEQSRAGAARVRAWLDHFEHWEMAEFNSAPYFPVDLNGLATLFALAPDADIAKRAGAAIIRLLTIVARAAHHGMITAAQGRSYENTLRAGRSLELSAIARLVWGRGWYGRRMHALPQLALALRDHGLRIPADLAGVASHGSEDAQEWCFAQGRDRFAALYHYKTATCAMGSAAHYRWGEWGYQETLLHLRIGTRPEAAIWINHPGETIQFGFGRPSYWGGCGTIPRVHQYRGLAVLDFAISKEQSDFTHAWFPVEMFDEARIAGSLAMARSGEGYCLLKGSSNFTLLEEGPTAGAELRLGGRRARWIVRLGGSDDAADLQAHAARYGMLRAEDGPNGTILLEDPEYGSVQFHADGTIDAENRRLKPAEWTIDGTVEHLPLGSRSNAG
ncbi:MAG: hypothetical protein ACHQAY_15760 [Hyphomicrobiales bacterium]